MKPDGHQLTLPPKKKAQSQIRFQKKRGAITPSTYKSQTQRV
jgi:hypothetical protein